MLLDVSFVTGSGLVHTVDHRVQGTVSLSGQYSLTIMGVNTLLAINLSPSEIQKALESSLKSVLKGRVLLIDNLITDSSSNKEYRIVCPVSMGAVTLLNLDTTSTLGGNLVSNVSTVSVGTYEPLKGYFNLQVDGQTTAPLLYSASAGDMEGGLEALSVVSNVSVSRFEGVVDEVYKGYEWNITFEGIRKFNYYGVVQLLIQSDVLYGCSVRVELLQSGRGPLMPLELTFDGQHFTENRAMLEVIEPSVLSSLSPLLGPNVGGTIITIQVNELCMQNSLMSYDARCVFNTAVVPARFTSNSSLECITPRYPLLGGGLVEVGVTLDGQHIATGLSFTYQPVVSALMVAPNCGSIGGGTEVRITGRAIVASVDASCSFDGLITPAVCIDGLITCRTPAVNTTRVANLTYSINGQNYLSSGLSYQFALPPSISSITPFTGSMAGGTRVTVTGKNLAACNGALASCRFGEEVVPAQVASDSSMSCTVPPLQPTPEIQTITLGTVPYLPEVQKVSIRSDPLRGSVYQISGGISDVAYIPQQEVLVMNVADVNEVQKISIGTDPSPPRTALLSVSDTGRRQEVQTISTYTAYQPEIQVLYIRAPYDTFLPSYQEVHEVFASDLAATVTVTVSGLGTVTLSQTPAATQTALASRYPFASGCTVSISSTVAGRVWTITYTQSASAAGTIPALSATASSGTYYARVRSKGGVAEIQRLDFTSPANGGHLRLTMEGLTTANMPLNSTESQIKANLALLATVGRVSVQIVTAPSLSWIFTFLERAGSVPLMTGSLLGGATASDIYQTQKGTTSPISGVFTLSLSGQTTTPLSTNDTGVALTAALNTLSTVIALGGVAVTRYATPNKGAMFLVEFANTANVPLLTIDNTKLVATALSTSIATYQDGNTISGSFIISTNTVDVAARYSTPVPYDASTADIALAIAELDISSAPVVVTRIPRDVTGTYMWTITFPFAAGNVHSLDVNAAGLSGNLARAETSTLQDGQEASSVLVSTSASSPVYGFFTLTLAGHTTVPLAHNTSAEEMSLALEDLFSVGSVIVTRTSTGMRDDNTWGLGEEGYQAEGFPPLDEIHLKEVYPLFIYDLDTFEWLITFTSLSGEVPMLTSCCDEVNSATASSITLRSELSSDAMITIQKITQGTTKKISGNISVIINNIESPSFHLNASATSVQNAISALGYENISVIRLNPDLNGLYSWRIFWMDSNMPLLDAYLSPPLAPQTNQIFPPYTRQGVSFNWEYELPVHEIQQIDNDRTFTGIISCKIHNSTVTFHSTDGDVSVQSKFNQVNNSSYGNVIVQSNFHNSTGTTTERLVIFTAYLSNVGEMTCVGIAGGSDVIKVRTVQNGSLVPLGGTFKIGRQLRDGGYNYSAPISALAGGALEVETAVNGLYGDGAVIVSMDVAEVHRRVWSVTFAGSGVGGDIPLLGVQSLLTGVNAYATTNVTVHGVQPEGSVILNYGSTNISLPVASEAFVVADQLSSLLSGTFYRAVYCYVFCTYYCHIFRFIFVIVIQFPEDVDKLFEYF